MVDTSAIAAIMLEEPDAGRFHDFLGEAAGLISVASVVELARLGLQRFGPSGVAEARGLLDDYELELVPVDETQMELALQAMLAFGKGRGEPPAILNWGDLFPYALAKTRNLPLLFKGDDFAATDIVSALE